MITYNHDPYIEQAINGVLMQKCNFPFELVIGEDSSLDRTYSICQKYADKYSKIRLVPSTTNLGMYKNLFRTLESCNRKYIALCEGDDYWTDPYKLQKQVDFLETHPDYSFSCHLVDILNEETEEINHYAKDHIINNKDRVITINDFLNPFLIITASVIFRKEAFKFKKKLSPHFKDISLFACLLSVGKGILLNECMAVYRIHDGGIWSKKSNLLKCKANAYTLIEMDKSFKSKNAHIKTNASLQIQDYLNLLIAGKEKNILEKSKIFIILLVQFNDDISFKMFLKILKRILKSIV